ncbi:gamma-glutamylcyclotransferase [Pandoraea morbifera]|uniref:Gamma-glutamylcyclotransferase n=1 Tax=Pandoraea morbifera TaxID=2508300 RepID=A0A5E4WWU3_9BURK|nr:gamma-glutamylcyclotransferase [Pandoraea morbifera]
MTTAMHDTSGIGEGNEGGDHEAARDDACHAFVYGTLRAGEINDMRLAAARHGIAAPIYVGTTSLGGRLYDFGAYPGMVLARADEGGASRVVGDVYRIPAALVPVLDEIEEVYPGEPGRFVREVHEVECGGTTYACIVYPVSESAVVRLPRIDGGDWVAYRRARDGADTSGVSGAPAISEDASRKALNERQAS